MTLDQDSSEFHPDGSNELRDSKPVKSKKTALKQPVERREIIVDWRDPRQMEALQIEFETLERSHIEETLIEFFHDVKIRNQIYGRRYNNVAFRKRVDALILNKAVPWSVHLLLPHSIKGLIDRPSPDNTKPYQKPSKKNVEGTNRKNNMAVMLRDNRDEWREHLHDQIESQKRRGANRLAIELLVPINPVWLPVSSPDADTLPPGTADKEGPRLPIANDYGQIKYIHLPLDQYTGSFWKKHGFSTLQKKISKGKEMRGIAADGHVIEAIQTNIEHLGTAVAHPNRKKTQQRELVESIQKSNPTALFGDNRIIEDRLAPNNLQRSYRDSSPHKADPEHKRTHFVSKLQVLERKDISVSALTEEIKRKEVLHKRLAKEAKVAIGAAAREEGIAKRAAEAMAKLRTEYGIWDCDDPVLLLDQQKALSRAIEKLARAETRAVEAAVKNTQTQSALAQETQDLRVLYKKLDKAIAEQKAAALAACKAELLSKFLFAQQTASDLRQKKRYLRVQFKKAQSEVARERAQFEKATAKTASGYARLRKSLTNIQDSIDRHDLIKATAKAKLEQYEKAEKLSAPASTDKSRRNKLIHQSAELQRANLRKKHKLLQVQLEKSQTKIACECVQFETPTEQTMAEYMRLTKELADTNASMIRLESMKATPQDKSVMNDTTQKLLSNSSKEVTFREKEARTQACPCAKTHEKADSEKAEATKPDAKKSIFITPRGPLYEKRKSVAAPQKEQQKAKLPSHIRRHARGFAPQSAPAPNG